jgi:hypothetical protein
MVRRQVMMILAGAFLVGMISGCEEKLTFERWETIHAGQTPVAVEECLGEPWQKAFDQWTYQDHDRHITAHIYWNEDGTKVICKQWYDPEQGWHGQNPDELEMGEMEGTTIEQSTNQGTIN